MSFPPLSISTMSDLGNDLFSLCLGFMSLITPITQRGEYNINKIERFRSIAPTGVYIKKYSATFLLASFLRSNLKAKATWYL